MRTVPRIGRIYKLTDPLQAYERILSQRARGKVVVKVH
jgi:NADPH:quinone reductase-like Zn-dependent oxidoreductase